MLQVKELQPVIEAAKMEVLTPNNSKKNIENVYKLVVKLSDNVKGFAKNYSHFKVVIQDILSTFN